MRDACASAVFSRSALGEAAPSGLWVLLVDDNAEFLTSAVRLLGLLPKSELYCVGSGEEAIAELARFNPHVVFLNDILPDMDGLKMAQKVKQGLRPPRVVILSSSGDPKYQSAARAAGADRIISKTQFFVELLRCIAMLLRENLANTVLASVIS